MVLTLLERPKWPEVEAVLRELDDMPAATLDVAEQHVRNRLPGWFIYRGGSHVAIHRRSGADRIGLVTEATNEQAFDAAYAALVTWLHREEGMEPRSAAKAVGASYGLPGFVAWALDRIEGGAA